MLSDNAPKDTAHARHGQAVRLTLAEWQLVVSALETTASLDTIRDKLATIGITTKHAGSYRKLRNLAASVKRQANV